MKRKFLIGVPLLLSIGIVFSVWRFQRAKEEAARQEALAMQSQVQTLQKELTETRAHEQEQRVAPVLPPGNKRVVEVANIPATSPTPNTAPNPAMLNDPETRALMRKQQDQALAKLAEKIVSKEFARDWNLSPEAAAQAKDWVREKAAAGKDLLNAMLFDGLNDDALAQRGRETKQRLEQADAALRGLLGENGFRAITEQEHALEDRQRLKHLGEELANADQGLSDEQRAALLAALSAERQSFTFRVDYGDVSKIDFEHPRDYFSEANLQTYFEDMQQLNTRIGERAALFLSPAQIEQFKAAQNNQMEQGRLTVKMTTELFNKRRPN